MTFWYSFVRRPVFENDPKLHQWFNCQKPLHILLTNFWLVPLTSLKFHQNVCREMKLKVFHWLVSEKRVIIFARALPVVKTRSVSSSYIDEYDPSYLRTIATPHRYTHFSTIHPLFIHQNKNPIKTRSKHHAIWTRRLPVHGNFFIGRYLALALDIL